MDGLFDDPPFVIRRLVCVPPASRPGAGAGILPAVTVVGGAVHAAAILTDGLVLAADGFAYVTGVVRSGLARPRTTACSSA
jgi:hypothetical protein